MPPPRLRTADVACWVIKTSRPPADLVADWLPGSDCELFRCVRVRLALLARPVSRADLLADPGTRDAEVLRMPAGSNPSWLSPAQYAAVRALGA